MRTLLFTLEFPPFKGGVANYYGNLVTYWPIDENLWVLDNQQGRLQRGSGFLAWRYAYGALKRKVNKSKIDYVLVGQILPLGTVTALLSLFQPLKYAIFLHGMDLSYALKIRRKRLLAKFILRRADKIICANNYVATKVIDFYPAGQEKITVLNPGIVIGHPNIDSQKLQKLSDIYHLENKINLFSLGRLIKRKGVDQVIRALAEIPESLLNNLVYFIAGSGQAEDYLRALVPPKLNSKIIFLGNLSETDKWLWFKKADIFLMPAREIAEDFEGFGIVYLEANLSSLPVIAGRSGGVADAVIDGYNGLMVDPENIISIKEAIIKLATNADLRQELGEQGRIRAIKNFNWEKQVSKLLKIIKH